MVGGGRGVVGRRRESLKTAGQEGGYWVVRSRGGARANRRASRETLWVLARVHTGPHQHALVLEGKESINAELEAKRSR